jgi:hypothetical protein
MPFERRSKLAQRQPRHLRRHTLAPHHHTHTPKSPTFPFNHSTISRLTPSLTYSLTHTPVTPSNHSISPSQPALCGDTSSPPYCHVLSLLLSRHSFFHFLLTLQVFSAVSFLLLCVPFLLVSAQFSWRGPSQDANQYTWLTRPPDSASDSRQLARAPQSVQTMSRQSSHKGVVLPDCHRTTPSWTRCITRCWRRAARRTGRSGVCSWYYHAHPTSPLHPVNTAVGRSAHPP